jgi:hypothetical protein
MRRNMLRRRLSGLLFLFILSAVAWLVLERVRIVVVVPLSPLALLGIIVGVAVIIYLLIDHALNRTR